MKKPKIKFVGKVVDLFTVKKVNNIVNEFLQDLENDSSMPKTPEERDKAFAELRRRYAERKKENKHS